MKSLLICGLLLLAPWLAFGLTCAELDTPAKIRAFVSNARDSNPLWRKSLSAHVEVSPCEMAECGKANRKIRLAKTKQVHLVRRGENSRAFITKGIGSPQCSVRRGSRNFLCAECRFTENSACRSIVPASGPSRIEGTNIDTTDFDLVAGAAFASRCNPLPKSPNYLQIVSNKKKGNSPFDKVISYYEKEREVPVTINFLSKNVLRKVYRFFPKYYTRIEGQWVATIIRVRTTNGSEKRYVFETQLRIRTDRARKLLLYLDPNQDPLLQATSLDTLFLTN